jgi:hypothetical protein
MMGMGRSVDTGVVVSGPGIRVDNVLGQSRQALPSSFAQYTTVSRRCNRVSQQTWEQGLLAGAFSGLFPDSARESARKSQVIEYQKRTTDDHR